MDDDQLPSEEQLKAVPQEAMDDTDGYWDKVNAEVKHMANQFLIGAHTGVNKYLAVQLKTIYNIIEYQSDELTIFRKMETYIKTGKADTDTFELLFKELVVLRIKRQQSLKSFSEQQQKEGAAAITEPRTIN